ncbi:MAG: hypothetical protein Q9Q40_11855 [Acidobacteriota bacterium]|nr:hypothetical protein [Acidobacteriota bacterium]
MRPEFRTYNGTAAVFEAAGLEKGTSHRFRVSFCREEDGVTGCTCRSEWTAADTPGTFTSAPVSHETPQLHEDYFDCREPKPKRKRTGALPAGGRGDGIGPDEAWQDEWLLPNGSSLDVGNGAHISEDAASVPFALVPTQSLLGLQAVQAQDPHVWAEVEFQSLSTAEVPNPGNAQSYNLELHARFLSVGTISNYIIYSYMLKFLYEPDDFSLTSTPTLRVYRNNGTPVGTQGDLVGSVTLADLETADPSDDCKDIDQLENGNVDALLQIRVENGQNNPTIHATVARGCTLTSCSHICNRSVSDLQTVPGDPLYEAKNRWAIFTHHWDHRLDVFRVGSTLAP